MSDSLERFDKTTRWFHWTFVASFLTLACTGALLAAREVLGFDAAQVAAVVRIHLGAAVALVVIPTVVVLSGQTHRTLGELRELLRWSRADLRWLALQPLAALGRAELPPAGKLNAGQKVNGLGTAALTAALATTGLWLWLHPGSLVAWFVHVAAFLAWIPLFAGHFTMAVVLPGTRPALRGMITGRVDRAWAEHHHPLWAHAAVAVKRAAPAARSGPAEVPATVTALPRYGARPSAAAPAPVAHGPGLAVLASDERG